MVSWIGMVVGVWRSCALAALGCCPFRGSPRHSGPLRHLCSSETAVVSTLSRARGFVGVGSLLPFLRPSARQQGGS